MARTGNRKTRRTSTGTAPVPQLIAEGPAEVNCWDDSWLPGTTHRVRFALYLVFDLSSRKILAFSVQSRDDSIIARDLIRSVVDQHLPVVHTVHSDNGKIMVSELMTTMLSLRAVALSTIRPGVSNDDAQIES